ncbi:MAG: Uncharacterized protein G01um101433_131 [Parcubacteria group bacterium Gr01-1014_33]|nr:MAG: Uncharacterized protein G01um101433_131 [Parcubacteria group bacterium Gr01-1014_33]
MRTYEPHAPPSASLAKGGNTANNNKSKSHLFAMFAYHSCRSHYVSGFTILETLIAFSVITAALLGPVALVTRSLYSAPFSKNKLVATNLAQEGIELIRAIRENNAICEQKGAPPSWKWDRDFDGGGKLHSGSNNLTIDPTVIVSQTCVSGAGGVTIANPTRGSLCGTRPILLDSSGRYNYVSGGTTTIFKRCVWVTQNATGSEDAVIPGSDIMTAISVVLWQEKNEAKSITISEKLYNWK